ncbi:acyltransferase [Ferrimonas sp. YFM]|uniref:acyltransferase family protein n=1 Tax=Ferrimonas sp. YFM TaxID=3028878 RepID=UPI00257280CC|nr:acyltransferase [Ferrimonas sp. YFM]BDY04078.1 exopolysaccharide production protein ExoZ [Ferrimonas sp. YFM]
MLISVQYLRAFAAVMVVLTHTAHKLNVNSVNILDWFEIGHYGVDLFFIISGFIMCLTVEKKSISFHSFMKARFIRILPLYWVLTTVALIIYLVEPSLVNSSGGNTSILTSYFLIPTESKFLIRNGWTLSYEFLFYLIFAAFIFSSRQKFYSSLCLVSLVLLGTISPIDTVIFDFITSPLLLEFFFGILSYKIIKQEIVSPWVALLLIIISVSLLITLNAFGPINSFLDRSLYAGLPMFIFFVGFVSLEKYMPKFKFLYNVGMSSYSLYLLHPFALSGVTVVFKVFGLIEIPYLYMLCMIIGSVVSSYLCYIWVELRLDKAIKNKSYVATLAR